MKLKNKIIIIISLILTSMLVFPIIINNVAGKSGMLLCMILFYIINPLVSCVVGGISGTDIPKLWWAPIVTALFFPLFFWISMLQIEFSLFVYSIGYLIFGVMAMLGTYLMKKSN